MEGERRSLPKLSLNTLEAWLTRSPLLTLFLFLLYCFTALGTIFVIMVFIPKTLDNLYYNRDEGFPAFLDVIYIIVKAFFGLTFWFTAFERVDVPFFCCNNTVKSISSYLWVLPLLVFPLAGDLLLYYLVDCDPLDWVPLVDVGCPLLVAIGFHLFGSTHIRQFWHVRNQSQEQLAKAVELDIVRRQQDKALYWKDHGEPPAKSRMVVEVWRFPFKAAALSRYLERPTVDMGLEGMQLEFLDMVQEGSERVYYATKGEIVPRGAHFRDEPVALHYGQLKEGGSAYVTLDTECDQCHKHENSHVWTLIEYSVGKSPVITCTTFGSEGTCEECLTHTTKNVAWGAARVLQLFPKPNYVRRVLVTLILILLAAGTALVIVFSENVSLALLSQNDKLLRNESYVVIVPCVVILVIACSVTMAGYFGSRKLKRQTQAGKVEGGITRLERLHKTSLLEARQLSRKELTYWGRGTVAGVVLDLLSESESDFDSSDLDDLLAGRLRAPPVKEDSDDIALSSDGEWAPNKDLRFYHQQRSKGVLSEADLAVLKQTIKEEKRIARATAEESDDEFYEMEKKQWCIRRNGDGWFERPSPTAQEERFMENLKPSGTSSLEEEIVSVIGSARRGFFRDYRELELLSFVLLSCFFASTAAWFAAYCDASASKEETAKVESLRIVTLCGSVSMVFFVLAVAVAWTRNRNPLSKQFQHVSFILLLHLISLFTTKFSIPTLRWCIVWLRDYLQLEGSLAMAAALFAFVTSAIELPMSEAANRVWRSPGKAQASLLLPTLMLRVATVYVAYYSETSLVVFSFIQLLTLIFWLPRTSAVTLEMTEHYNASLWVHRNFREFLCDFLATLFAVGFSCHTSSNDVYVTVLVVLMSVKYLCLFAVTFFSTKLWNALLASKGFSVFFISFLPLHFLSLILVALDLSSLDVADLVLVARNDGVEFATVIKECFVFSV